MQDAHIANTAAGPIQKVVLADKDTGEAINPAGGPGGGGDASAANQTAQIALETAIRDRLPGSTSVTKVNATAGASLTALAAGACRMVFVNNNRSDAVDLEWDLGSGGTEIIAAGSYRMIDGISNASQIRLRRADGLATALTVSTELRA